MSVRVTNIRIFCFSARLTRTYIPRYIAKGCSVCCLSVCLSHSWTTPINACCLCCRSSTSQTMKYDIDLRSASAGLRQWIAINRPIYSSSLAYAYYKFPELESWSAGRTSLSQDHLCGTVLLLYGDQRWHCILSRDNWRPLMCWRTEGRFITARRCCSVFVILAPDTKLQTYLLT